MDKCMNSLSVCMLLICVKGKVGRIKGSKKDFDEKALFRKRKEAGEVLILSCLINLTS